MFNLYTILLFLSPVIHYRIVVDAGDTTGYGVEMQISHAPAHFRLAMATHPEYDDGFWRFVKDFKVKPVIGKAFVIRKDSALYEISIPGNQCTVSYRIQLPATHSFAHRPFLSSYGGLVGDLHSFFYLVGQTHLPAKISFDLPAGWEIATGLEPSIEKNTFTAGSAAMLMDCPVLIGHLHRWRFLVKGIPHTIAYLPAPNSPAFDTALLVANIKKIVEQTVSLFGGIPYRHYSFLLEDGVYGALEHANSVTLGMPASMLATRMQDGYEEIAHEFSHSWNLVSIHPEEYTGLTYGPQERSAGLWFSEGLTMFYADLLVRRAGLPCEDSSRMAHLASLIGRYYADTGNRVYSPAAVSLASNAGPGALGDYEASTHLQGELLGAMLDMLIRNCSDGRHSFDDVMKLMYTRFGGKAGFKTTDIERAVNDVCNNSEVHSFFENYLYQGNSLDFDPYLRMLGLALQLSWQPAADNKGLPKPDDRLYIWQPAGDTVYRLIITDPRSCWGRTGLHSKDIILAFDGQGIKDRPSFYTHLNTLKIGDTASVLIHRSAGNQTVRVCITGYPHPQARLSQLQADDRTAILFREWNAGR